MLLLNEKKIRQGKPIGLPYQGSKKKIAKKIVEIIKQNFGTDKPVYDVFGGGGAITAECLLNGLTVHYNDKDKTITDCFQRVLNQDREWLKTLIVSRDEFLAIRDKADKTVDDHLKLLVNSFGNKRLNYLYAEAISDIKYKMAIDIIKNHDVFSGYKQTETYREQLEQLQRLQQLEQLQRLQQLEQLQRLQQLEHIEVTSLDYKAFSHAEGAIFYLDPPYENAVGYGEKISRKMPPELYKEVRAELLELPLGAEVVHDGFVCKRGKKRNAKCMYYRDKRAIETFDSQAFYDWAYEMSKKNIVLVSSYAISDPRFEVVFEFPTAKSTLQSGTIGDYEKLFMVT